MFVCIIQVIGIGHDFMRDFPGKSALRFVLKEAKQNWRISLVTGTNGFEMNDDLIQFLEQKPELDVQVVLN